MAFAVVGDVLVDFVGDGERIELLTESGDESQFFARKNFAGRIVWRVQDDGFGPLGKRGAEFIGVERPVGCAGG